jgi:hypothetical protein
LTSKPEQMILLDVLEAIYFDTVTPLAALLRDAGVDLLNFRIDRDADSYWEDYPAYSALNSER